MILASLNIRPIAILYTIIISLSISLSFTLGDGNRNLVLIGVMGLTPLVIIRYLEFNKIDFILILFMIAIVLCPLANHPERMRWSTVMYSIMFSLTFLALIRLIRHCSFSAEQYLNVIKYLIYAYTIVLLIQQFCVLVGLPIFNLSNYSIESPWKLNSLAPEPSLSGRIVGLLMFSFIVIKEVIKDNKYSDFKEDKYIWISFLWTMLTMGSGTAFIFIALIAMKFISIKNSIIIFLLFAGIIFVGRFLEITAIERSYNTTIATLTLDEKTIIKTDHSASLRIVPLIICAKMVDFVSIDGLFGHGIDTIQDFLYKMIPGMPKGMSGGGLFQLWYEYGFIPFLLFSIFSMYASVSIKDYRTLLLWFLLVFFYGINNQMVWLTIVLLYLNKHFIAAHNAKQSQPYNLFLKNENP